MTICGFCGEGFSDEKDFFNHSKLHEQLVDRYFVTFKVGHNPGFERRFTVRCLCDPTSLNGVFASYEGMGATLEHVSRGKVRFGIPEDVAPRHP